MEARLKLKPGQNGTKKLLARFGERLVCVRYRYDAARSLRFTTVELIESALRAKLKALGALWRPRHKLWELTWGAVQVLGIEHRVISNTGNNPDEAIPPAIDM